MPSIVNHHFPEFTEIYGVALVAFIKDYIFKIDAPEI